MARTELDERIVADGDKLRVDSHVKKMPAKTILDGPKSKPKINLANVRVSDDSHIVLLRHISFHKA